MTIVALAGRRIDADGAPARFPLDQAPRVRRRLETLLRELHPDALVCSAACGADLLALEAALEQNIPVTIVLPFERKRFRATSVVDRPGGWGPRFDTVMKHVRDHKKAGRIHVIPAPSGGDDDAYQEATDAILNEAEKLAGAEKQMVAVIVWEGASRGEGDLTDYFRRLARRRRFKARVISSRRRGSSSGATSRRSRVGRKK